MRTRAAVGNLPQVLGNAYGAIILYLNELGEQPSDAPFVAYYNMDMQALDLEIGFCFGPYSQLEPAYHALMQWIGENEYTATGVEHDFYLNEPGKTPESELLTKIVFPLL
ncbi:MAG: GyrI-like domain-containing protein [Desulfotomaculaceae bacterium]